MQKYKKKDIHQPFFLKISKKYNNKAMKAYSKTYLIKNFRRQKKKKGVCSPFKEDSYTHYYM